MTLLDEPKAGAADPAATPAARSSASATGRFVLALVAAAVRAAIAAVSGVLLSGGAVLLVWALTPAATTGPVAALGTGAAFFAAALGMDVRVGSLTLTVAPLLFTAIGAALLAAAVRRGRFLPIGRGQEAAVAGVAALTYGLVVAAAPGQLGAGALVSAAQWWRPVALGLLIAGVATFTRRGLPVTRLRWIGAGLRMGAVGTAGMVAGGALAVAVGLGASFSLASRFAETTAPGAADGIGLVLLGAAFLPNAVVAGAGYASGWGFTIGGGTYSPLATHAAPVLPQLPLLAAAPLHSGISHSGLVLLVVPVLVGAVLGRGAVRRASDRTDRIRVAALGSAVAGAALGVLAWLASGGVTPGPWSSAGVAAVPFALVVALELGVVSVAVAAVARPVPAAAGDEAQERPDARAAGAPVGRGGPRSAAADDSDPRASEHGAVVDACAEGDDPVAPGPSGADEKVDPADGGAPAGHPDQAEGSDPAGNLDADEANPTRALDAAEPADPVEAGDTDSSDTGAGPDPQGGTQARAGADPEPSAIPAPHPAERETSGSWFEAAGADEQPGPDAPEVPGESPGEPVAPTRRRLARRSGSDARSRGRGDRRQR